MDDRDLQIVKTYGKGVGIDQGTQGQPVSRSSRPTASRSTANTGSPPTPMPTTRCTSRTANPAHPHDGEVPGLQALRRQVDHQVRRRGGRQAGHHRYKMWHRKPPTSRHVQTPSQAAPHPSSPHPPPAPAHPPRPACARIPGPLRQLDALGAFQQVPAERLIFHHVAQEQLPLALEGVVERAPARALSASPRRNRAGFRCRGSKPAAAWRRKAESSSGAGRRPRCRACRPPAGSAGRRGARARTRRS